MVAGDLFNVPDHVIVNDLTDVVNKILEIASLPEYTRNDNDQSVVEICITRVTSAISPATSTPRVIRGCTRQHLRLSKCNKA
ncbi:Protein melted [Portunus trituberculatus]|uniref:Protein melted n=1 Tax=Portunus trituberculatus TaxID=210409 RepID=A0A5B7DAL0_PORTR|nr:Protein melted [Portunus trituberculatus]